MRGVGVPFVAIAKGTIEPLDDGERSRVTIALELEAHGIGKLLVGFVVRQARTQLARNAQELKDGSRAWRRPTEPRANGDAMWPKFGAVVAASPLAGVRFVSRYRPQSDPL